MADNSFVCPERKLLNGMSWPQMGFGVAMIERDAVQTTIDTAIEAGYRMFDTSALYGNEKEVGEAFRNNGIPRESLRICSKLPNEAHRYEDALAAYRTTCRALGVEYLDLYMIYWPCPARGLYCEAWRALEHLYKAGDVRMIGVSNFQEPHLDRLLAEAEIVPAVNELECNPYLSIAPLRKYCNERGIEIESWFPLGGPSKKLFGNVSTGPNLREDPVVGEIAAAHGRSIAQVLLRWAVQSNIIPLPKSSHRERIFENISVFDFALTDADMARIDALNINLRNGHDPATTNEL